MHQPRERSSFVRLFLDGTTWKLLLLVYSTAVAFFASARTFGWVLCLSNCLSLVSSPPVVSYYSGLSPEERFICLIIVVSRTEFAVLAVISARQFASERFLDISKTDSCIKHRVFDLVALSSPFIVLVDAAGISTSLDGYSYKKATGVLVWKVVRLVNRLAVTSELVAQLLYFSVGSGTVFDVTTAGATRLI